MEETLDRPMLCNYPQQACRMYICQKIQSNPQITLGRYSSPYRYSRICLSPILYQDYQMLSVHILFGQTYWLHQNHNLYFGRKYDTQLPSYKHSVFRSFLLSRTPHEFSNRREILHYPENFPRTIAIRQMQKEKIRNGLLQKTGKIRHV